MQPWLVGAVFAILTVGASAQQAINITGCTVPCDLATALADVLIFVDSSRGTGLTNVNLIKSALIQWQNPFSVGNGSDDMLRVALVDYALFATAHGLLAENHESHEELIDLINNMNFHNNDNRNLYYGLIEGLTNLNPEFGGLRSGNVPKIGMIFSGGNFTGQPAGPIFNSYTAQGFIFYGIGIGINSNLRELGDLVGVDNVFQTVNAEQLQYVVGWLLNKACNGQSMSTGAITASTTPGPTGPVDPCTNYNCGNGTCVLHGLHPECKCIPCYTGPRCDLYEFNPCDGFGELCGDHGTCMFNLTTCRNPYCNCTDGYTGDFCSNAGTTASAFRSYKLYDVPNRGK